MRSLIKSTTIRTIALSLLVCGLCSCACTNDNDSNKPTTPVQPDPKQPEQPDPKQPDKKTVRVATWNVHRFFDLTCDSGTCGSGQYEPANTQSYFNKKVEKIANGINGLDADVILLQEIESEMCMNSIQVSIGANNYPNFAFGETGSAASLDVGIFTRGTIDKVTVHRSDHVFTLSDGTEKKLARELLQAEITLPNGEQLTAFTTHLVSKATDAVGERRLREAEVVQQILASYVAEHPGRLIVFGGDLNDNPDSAPIQAIGKDGVLVSVTDGRPESEITTWSGTDALDHIFIPAGLKSAQKEAVIVCGETTAQGYSDSDHCALRVDFEF